MEARDLALAKSYGRSHALGILWRVKGDRGLHQAQWAIKKELGLDLGASVREPAESARPGWKGRARRGLEERTEGHYLQ